jgi:hypothetical protein
LGGKSGSRHRQVVDIPARIGGHVRGPDDPPRLSKESDDLVYRTRSDLEPGLQAPAKFRQDVRGQHDLVRFQADGRQRLAQAPRAEGRHQDMGVRDDLHETALKTSSSVRNPSAWAKGTVYGKGEPGSRLGAMGLTEGAAGAILAAVGPAGRAERP